MDEAAGRFEDLIERYHDEIYNYVWRLLGSTPDNDPGGPDADDVTQEVFVRALKAFGRLRPNSNARAWLYKIATRCAYTAMSRGRRQADRTLPSLDQAHDVPDETPTLHEQAARHETILALQQAISALPGRQRQAVILRYGQCLEYDEMAVAMECTQATARANVHQAVRRLRQVLDE